MSIIEITEREDLRVGDVATFAYDGHEFTGPLWEREEGTLFLGSESVRYKYRPSGEHTWSYYFDFICATREAPSLPTEPGAVVYVTECRGERADKPVVAVRAGDGEWVTPAEFFAGYVWHPAEHITEWTPAKVIPA